MCSSLAMYAARARSMESVLVARMSRQISYGLPARRVVSLKPGPATSRSSGDSRFSATVAARAVDANCGRCEVKETTRSCWSGPITSCVALLLARHRMAAEELAAANHNSGQRHDRRLGAAGIGDQRARPDQCIQPAER